MSALQVVVLWGSGVGTAFEVMSENSQMGCNFTSSLLCYGRNFGDDLVNIFSTWNLDSSARGSSGAICQRTQCGATGQALR